MLGLSLSPAQATWQSPSHGSLSRLVGHCLLSATALSDSTTSSLQISSLSWGNTNGPGPCAPSGDRTAGTSLRGSPVGLRPFLHPNPTRGVPCSLLILLTLTHSPWSRKEAQLQE